MKKVKWAIVGLGAQAERLAQRINQSSQGELWAVVDKNKKRAQEFAAVYRSPHYFLSLTELFKTARPDALLVASPNFEHAQHSLAALAEKCPVLCEKPMALSLKEAQAVKKAASASRQQFGVGFHLRFHPVFLAAKKIIASGDLGQIKLVQINWSVGRAGETEFPALPPHQRWREEIKLSGGGALMARGVHLFDLSTWLLGQEAGDIFSLSDAKSKKQVDQTTVGAARFGKTLVELATSRQVPFAMNQVIIYSSHGRLLMPEPFTYDGTGILRVTTEKKDTIKKFTKKLDLYQLEINDFSRAVLTKRAWSGASAADGVKSVAMAEKWSGLKG